jgi:hypothetical protein
VLVIDEAYILYSSTNGGIDSYRTAAVDTIVAEVQGTPGEDRCVLLLGYEDEAYQFVENFYGKEAVNQMVDAMTKPKFAGKLIIILAGYDRQMNELLQLNPGLNGRFPDELKFPPMGVEDCLNLLEAKLQEEHIAIPAIHDPDTSKQILDMITELSGFEFWGNARDIQTLAKTMIRVVYQNNQERVHQLEITASLALKCIQNMLSTTEK